MFFIDLSSIPIGIRVISAVCFYSAALVLYFTYTYYHKSKEKIKS